MSNIFENIDNNKELKGYEIDKLLLDENLPNEWPLLILIY
jgi:hypothetical protein